MLPGHTRLGFLYVLNFAKIMEKFEDLQSAANEFTPEQRQIRKQLILQKRMIPVEKRIEIQKQREEIKEVLSEISDENLLSGNLSFSPINLNPNVFLFEALKRLRNPYLDQKHGWEEFLTANENLDAIERELEQIKAYPLDSPERKRRELVLQTLKNQIEGKLQVPEYLVRLGVLGLLNASPNTTTKIYYLSDVIAPSDVAKTRILNHYDILEQTLGVDLEVIPPLGSTAGRSLQTGAQALQLIGSHSELEADYHRRRQPSHLSIFVNNADRSKHGGKELAEGSKCLWARVQDPKTNVIHDVIGVDNEVFAPLYDYIVDLFVIEGIPRDENFGDLSNGTQFRSLKKFIYPQALNAISGGGAPPGFEIRKVEKSEVIPKIEIKPNEMILVDPDHYGNGKSLCAHPDGIIGICEYLGVEVDPDDPEKQEKLVATFYHPDTGEKIDTQDFLPTKYLGKHPGENCIWNGSSRGLDGVILPEIGISKENPDDEVELIKELHIGTRIVLEKKN